MPIKIDSKITAYEVVNKDEEQKTAESNVVHMHEKLERPEMLLGSTYKIKTPLTEHALYVTINDLVLRGDPAREAPAIRNLHQFEEHGPLSVGGGAYARHFRGISQGW